MYSIKQARRYVYTVQQMVNGISVWVRRRLRRSSALYQLIALLSDLILDIEDALALATLVLFSLLADLLLDVVLLIMEVARRA